MKLFDENLARGLEKYNSVRQDDFEMFEKIVTSSEIRFLHSRDFLEDAFSNLDETSQYHIKKELINDPNKSKKTINELIVGSYLANLGYKVEYDKNINGQTPDWWVQDSDSNDLFFLDVRTQEVRSSSNAEFYKSSSSRKQFDDAIEKVNKYDEIIVNKKIPFLLALVSDWVVGIEMQKLAVSYYSFILNIDDKNYGYLEQVGENESFDKPYFKIGSDLYIELEEDEEEGVFKKTHLSGILDVKVNPFNYYEVSLTLNPNAEFKVSGEMFPNTELKEVYEVFRID